MIALKAAILSTAFFISVAQAADLVGVLRIVDGDKNSAGKH